MNSTNKIRQDFSENWDGMNDKEQMSTAGEMSVYFVELLAQVASKQGDSGQARKLLKAAMQLEAIIRDSENIQLKSFETRDLRKLH